MKKTFFSLFLFSVLIVWGCMDTKKISPDTTNSPTMDDVVISQEAQQQADKRITGNETCDNYIATIQCIANKEKDSTEQFIQDYESFVASFSNIPDDQLQDTCTTLTTAIQEHPTVLIYNSECNMLHPAQDEEVAPSETSTTTVQ